MQPEHDARMELLELAEATDRVAASIADAVVQARLRTIAQEVRALAYRDLTQGGEWPSACDGREPHGGTLCMA